MTPELIELVREAFPWVALVAIMALFVWSDKS